MDIIPIFAKPKRAFLWAVKYRGDKTNIYRKLMKQWTDQEYLLEFFKEHQEDLEKGFWKLSIEEARKKVLEEVFIINKKLQRIETENGTTFEDFEKVFKNFHDSSSSISFAEEDYKKAKPTYERNTMIRLYALKMEDMYIVSGGMIKIARAIPDALLKTERDNLSKIKKFCKEEMISDKSGLTN